MNLENRTILYLSDKPYATVWLRNTELVSCSKSGDALEWLSKSSDARGLGWNPRLTVLC